MKIFYITQVAIPSTAAESVGTMCLCEAFGDLAYETTLITRNTFWKRPPDGYNGNIWDFYGVTENFKVQKIFGLPRAASLPILETIFEHIAIRYVGKKDNIIYTRSASMAKLAVAHNYRVILELHTAVTDRNENILKQFIWSPCFLGLVVITVALRRYYTEKIPSLADKIVVAPDAVRYRAYAEASSAQGEKANRSQDEFVAGYVGSFYRGKGVEMIIKLAELCPDVSFKIYGGTRDKIRSFFGVNELPANLDILDFVPQSRVPRCMASFDMALLPNQEEIMLCGGQEIGKWTSPIKMFEYMASGCAIVASDLPVLREVLRDKHNALLVPPADYKAWKNAIRLLKSDPNLRRRLGSQAQKEAQQKYSWQTRAERIVQKFGLKN